MRGLTSSGIYGARVPRVRGAYVARLLGALANDEHGLVHADIRAGAVR